jgi:hypothetical protein
VQAPAVLWPRGPAADLLQQLLSVLPPTEGEDVARVWPACA